MSIHKTNRMLKFNVCGEKSDDLYLKGCFMLQMVSLLILHMKCSFIKEGSQWLSGRVLDSILKGCG